MAQTHLAKKMTLSVDITGLTGTAGVADLETPSAAYADFVAVTTAAFPDFRPNQIDVARATYTDQIDGVFPPQELTFTTREMHEGLLYVAGLPYGRLAGDAAAETLGATTSPILTFRTELTRNADLLMKTYYRKYNVKVASYEQSGVDEEGVQLWDCVCTPVYIFERKLSPAWSSTATDFQEASLQRTHLIDLINGNYEINGVDLWATRKSALGLT